MNKIYNKMQSITFEKIFMIFVLVQPIVDIITSLMVRNNMDISLGIIIRMGFLGLICIYTLIKLKNKKNLFIYYISISIYFILFIINSYRNFGFNLLFIQIKGLIKVFYFPILLVTLYEIFKEIKYKSMYKIININLFIFSFIIVICALFSIGFNTYGFGEKAGTTGLFYAGNEIGAIISIISAIFFGYLLNSEYKIKDMILCILTVYAIFFIGTKVPYLSLVIVFIIFLVKYIYNKEYKDIKKTVFFIIILLSSIIFIGKTPIGMNLNINPMENILKLFIINQDVEALNNNLNQVSTNVLSSRDIYLSDEREYYKKCDIITKIVGDGYIIEKDNNIIEKKLIEMDYFDIFFAHGILGTIVYVIPIMYIAFNVIIKIFKNYKKIFQDNIILFGLYSIGIAGGIALLAGHVLTAPAVSIYIIISILEVNNKLCEV